MALLSVSCASYQRVGVSSVPSGAALFVDGESMGPTPVEIRVDSREPHKLYFKKDGYRSQLVLLVHHAAADGVDFVTPADIEVRLVFEDDPRGRDLEVAPEVD